MPAEFIHLTISVIQSRATTPEEQAIGHLNRRNINILYMWYEWEQGKRNKTNQMNDLGIFDKPIVPLRMQLYLYPTGNMISREMELAELYSAVMATKDLLIC